MFNLSRYRKLGVALTGAAVIGLNQIAGIDVGSEEVQGVVATGVALLTALGVYQVRNSD